MKRYSFSSAFLGLPSRTSFIFYFGIEGLGGADMDTDEDEHVRVYSLSREVWAHKSVKGLEGPVKFSGSTPDLGDFTIRIVDGMIFCICFNELLFTCRKRTGQ